MSRYFKYEIDEKGLRSKLAGKEMPVMEDEWTKFEVYVASQKTSVAGSAWKSINININRAYFLPGAFGAIVIVFSLVLYNFVSIRRPTHNMLLVKPSTASEQKSNNPTLSVKKETTKIYTTTTGKVSLEIPETKITPELVHTGTDTQTPPVLANKDKQQDSSIQSETTVVEKFAKKKRRHKKDSATVTSVLPEIKQTALEPQEEQVPAEPLSEEILPN